ncbi:MAG: hypothetical protein PHP06_07660 [Clostridia bacterium]|nr:hypothetical protein [Clostridia bacterium]
MHRSPPNAMQFISLHSNHLSDFELAQELGGNIDTIISLKKDIELKEWKKGIQK